MPGVLVPGVMVPGVLVPGGLALARLVAAADQVTRDGARDAAERELRRPEYQDAQPPLVLRVIGYVLRWLAGLLRRPAALLTTGHVAEVVLVLLLALAVAVVLVRLGPLGERRPDRGGLLAGEPVRTAAEHRAQAEALAAQGQYAEAVRERLRAIVRELEVRGVLDPRPGRTAGEVARDAGAAAPALADDLHRAAGLFDEVWYGGRGADVPSYEVLTGVDDRVRSARAADLVPR